MKWRYDQKSKQDESETKEFGVYRQTYTIGRCDGRYRLARQDWRVKKVKLISQHIIGDFKRVGDAKAIAYMLVKSKWLPMPKEKIDKGAIERYLKSALDVLDGKQ